MICTVLRVGDLVHLLVIISPPPCQYFLLSQSSMLYLIRPKVENSTHGQTDLQRISLGINFMGLIEIKLFDPQPPT